MAGCPANPKKMIGNCFAFVPSRDLQMHTGEGRRDGGSVSIHVYKAKDGFLGGVKAEGGNSGLCSRAHFSLKREFQLKCQLASPNSAIGPTHTQAAVT